MITFITLILFIWFVCGVVAGALDFAYLNEKFPDRKYWPSNRPDHKRYARICILFGLAGLLVTLITHKWWKYGIDFSYLRKG